MSDTNNNKLSVKIRIIIGVCAMPSLFLLAMLIYAVIHGDSESIGAFELIYSIVGIVAMYMAVSGRRLF